MGETPPLFYSFYQTVFEWNTVNYYSLLKRWIKTLLWIPVWNTKKIDTSNIWTVSVILFVNIMWFSSYWDTGFIILNLTLFPGWFLNFGLVLNVCSHTFVNYVFSLSLSLFLHWILQKLEEEKEKERQQIEKERREKDKEREREKERRDREREERERERQKEKEKERERERDRERERTKEKERSLDRSKDRSRSRCFTNICFISSIHKIKIIFILQQICIANNIIALQISILKIRNTSESVLLKIELECSSFLYLCKCCLCSLSSVIASF